MATTPNVGIVYPVVGNTITPLATHFANLANSVDSAMVTERALREGIIGTDAERVALTGAVKREGLRWYSTDTNKNWFYDGSNWITNDGAMYLIQPSSVGGTGVTLVGGKAIITAGTGTANINGVFSSRFRNYKVVYEFTNGSAGFGMRLRAAGTDAVNSYRYWYAWNNSTTPAITNNATADNVALSVNLATSHWGSVDVFSPNLAAASSFDVSSNLDNGTTTYFARGSAKHTTASAYDGVTIFSTTGSPSPVNGTVAVYGYA